MANAESDARSVGGRIDAELAGLDALEIGLRPRSRLTARIWKHIWPKALAVAIFVGFWQIVVWTGWRPEYLLPGPAKVFSTLVDNLSDLLQAAGTTLGRAAQGFGLAIIIGSVVGAVVARVRVLRAAVGSLITGLQTMPSIAWFPLAILLFKLTDGAILFVVVLGAAPSIANGLISGIDTIPPLWLRAGRVLGARGISAFRHVILPAALPAFVAGLKQGWAFAWRSLLAGELLVQIPGTFSLGQRLEFARQNLDAAGLIAVMIVILVIGVLVDELLFGTAERAIRRRYGLVDEAADASQVAVLFDRAA
ncbi:MAG TPA: ABC transporter permease [Acidimicrobiia bacterium]|nr:ABC transporter permease [Acidimicrobiia bacterium]